MLLFCFFFASRLPFIFLMKFAVVLVLILGTSNLEFNQVAFYCLFFYVQELDPQPLQDFALIP